MGHIAPVCQGKVKEDENARRPLRHKGRGTNWVQTSQDLSDEEDEPQFSMYTVGQNSSKPIVTCPEVNGRKLEMELDTGAALSIISEQTKLREFPEAVLVDSDVILTTYTTEEMPVIGMMKVQVKLNERCSMLPLFVVKGKGPSLFGRNWLREIPIDWKAIHATKLKAQTTSVGAVLDKYADVFKDELGTFKDITVKLEVKENSKPKFHKPRAVPYAIREPIEDDLDRLEKAGIISKVRYSAWAAPIVPVPKKSGQIRICGDYKVTINPYLEVDSYPLPKPQDMLATLAGGQKFTKIDLSQAYQQLLLDEDAKKYLTVNIHKGLYCYNRMPFCIASAPCNLPEDNG